MAKLPVFKTVGRTFGFVVESRFFSLLRLIWLPTFLSIVVAFLPLMYEWEVYGLSADGSHDSELFEDPAYWAFEIFNIVASIVLSAIIAISVHRMILLDDRQPGVFFYWRLTRDEWLYMLAWILYAIVFVIALALPFAGYVYWLYTHDWAGQIPQAVDTDTVEGAQIMKERFKAFFADPRGIAASVLSLLFGLFALARFGLVFPIIVAEGRLSFFRSWAVTRGNFWRLVGFWIVVTILTYVLIVVMVAILAVAIMGMVLGVSIGGQTAGAVSILVLGVPAAVSLVTYIVVGVTIFIAGMSFTYKALTGDDPAAEAEEAAAA